jgi:hypothetical protein
MGAEQDSLDQFGSFVLRQQAGFLDNLVKRHGHLAKVA